MLQARYSTYISFQHKEHPGMQFPSKSRSPLLVFRLAVRGACATCCDGHCTACTQAVLGAASFENFHRSCLNDNPYIRQVPKLQACALRPESTFLYRTRPRLCAFAPMLACTLYSWKGVGTVQRLHGRFIVRRIWRSTPVQYIGTGQYGQFRIM